MSCDNILSWLRDIEEGKVEPELEESDDEINDCEIDEEDSVGIRNVQYRLFQIISGNTKIFTFFPHFLWQNWLKKGITKNYR